MPLPASASVSLAWVAHPRYFKLWPNPKLSTGRRRCARCWLAERHCVCGALPALAPLRRVRRIFTVIPPQELGHPNPNQNPNPNPNPNAHPHPNPNPHSYPNQVMVDEVLPAIETNAAQEDEEVANPNPNPNPSPSPKEDEEERSLREDEEDATPTR